MLALAMLLLTSFKSSGQDTILMDYFFENRTERCWVQDRQSNKNVISVAATGFGFEAWAIAAERGRISKAVAAEWINTGFDETLRVNHMNFGWLYHFTDRDGKPVLDTEVSSIDTVIFYQSAEDAARRLHDWSLLKKIRKHKDAINMRFMMPHGEYFSHGFHWVGNKPVFLGNDWEHYSEGVLIYKYFGVEYKPPSISYDLPLFVYYYPLCFCPDDKEMIAHLGKAIDYQVRKSGQFGFTSCDGPNGYVVLENTVISPLAVWSCSRYYPDKSRAMLEKLGDPWTTPARLVNKTWYSQDRIGIDDGACLVLLNPAKD